MKKLLILVLSSGLIQAGELETVKDLLKGCKGSTYKGLELHAIFAQAANFIDKDEIISLFVGQIETNNILKDKPKQRETLLNNFISNIDEHKKDEVRRALISKMTDESLKKVLQEQLDNSKINRSSNSNKDFFSFNSFAEQDFRAKKNLWNIGYCGGLLIFGPSCFKKPDLVDVGITSFCLTGLFFNNKKINGDLNSRIKQANKNWRDGLCLTGFATALWDCYQKPSKTNIGLAGLCLAGLYYNNKK